MTTAGPRAQRPDGTGRGRPALGFCFDRGFPAALIGEFARRLDHNGADQLWVVEDCFYTTGISLAASALAVTERLTLGLGILPAVARNPAITAMEIATLSGLAPGRVLPGIGHGVQDWMAQIGARPASPVTTLAEVITAVRRLLRGDVVTMTGRHVRLDGVRLDCAPAPVPPVLAGVRGPKSLAMAGQLADGVVLADVLGPAAVKAAVAQAAAGPGFHVAVYTQLRVSPDRRDAHRAMAPWLAGQLATPQPGLAALPFFADLTARYQAHGTEGLATMPSDWWAELGAIGNLDDAAAHIEALSAAGAHSVALFPSTDIDTARRQLDDVAALLS